MAFLSVLSFLLGSLAILADLAAVILFFVNPPMVLICLAINIANIIFLLIADREKTMAVCLPWRKFIISVILALILLFLFTDRSPLSYFVSLSVAWCAYDLFGVLLVLFSGVIAFISKIKSKSNAKK